MPTSSRPRKRPRKFNPSTLTFLARVMRYLANGDPSLKQSVVELARFSGQSSSCIKYATREMERHGWLERHGDLAHARGPDRATTYIFTDSFPVPAGEFSSRRVRARIAEVQAWPGPLPWLERAVVWAMISAGLSPGGEYDRGREPLASITDTSGGQISTLIRRLATSKRIHVLERKPRLRLRLAGPSGFIQDVEDTYPDVGTEQRRATVFRFVTHPRNEGQDLPAGAIAAALKLSVKQGREALYWLEKKEYVNCERKREKYKGNTANRYTRGPKAAEYEAGLTDQIFPNRARWLQEEMRKRHLSIRQLSEAHSGPARGTVRSVLRGDPVSERSLESIRGVLSKQPWPKIDPSQIPND